MRLLASLLLVILCLVGTADVAAADEIFILDGGVVLRGYVMREDGDKLVIRLSGFTETSRVTIERSQILERYVAKQPTASDGTPTVRPPVNVADAPPRPDTPIAVPEIPRTVPAPRSEPDVKSEDFVTRFIRLARVAIPDSPQGLLSLAVLLVMILVVLVSWGARLSDLEAPSLLTATMLAVLLGGCFVMDLFYSHELLRADRAVWVVPLQVAGWLAFGRLLLGGSVGRVVLLFAFMVSSLLTVLFVMGAVFVTV